MKVLQVITSFETGGAESLLCNMVPHLISHGVTVDVCIFNGKETPLLEKIQNRGDVIVYKLGDAYYNILYIWKLIRIMQKYDIIHTHNSSPQLFVAIANLFCRKKIVTTEHSTNNRKRGNRLLRVVDKWMYRRYDKIICISQIAQEKLTTHLGHEQYYIEKMCVINNGVDVQAIYESLPLVRANINSRDNVFVAVMVAGFREAKDQDTIIKSMALLPKGEYELWLVGDGVRRPEIENCIEQNGMKENVKLLGVRMDVPAILKAADVVIMSSHWEGLSLSNIEGMSAGKPFVASEVNGLKEVTKGYGILFPHEDAKALADILTRLKNDKVFYKEIASQCYIRAKQFDIKDMVEQYIAVYKTI